MKDVLPWLLSAITIYCMWRQGDKWKYVWALTLLNQFLWLAWIIISKSWGLLPMTFAIAAISYRNHFKWRNDNCTS